MQTKLTIAFLSIFFLSGCGYFQSASPAEPDTTTPYTSTSAEQASPTTSQQNINTQTSSKYKTDIQTSNQASQTLDVDLCKKISVSKDRTACQDEVYLNLAINKQNAKYCEKIQVTEIKQECQRDLEI